MDTIMHLKAISGVAFTLQTLTVSPRSLSPAALAMGLMGSMQSFSTNDCVD
jgi:hypothetical protein